MAVFEFGREGIEQVVRVNRDGETVEVNLFVDTSEEGLAKFYDLQKDQEKASKKAKEAFPDDDIKENKENKETFLKMIEVVKESMRLAYDGLFGEGTYAELLDAGLSVFQTRDLFEQIADDVSEKIEERVAEKQSASTKAKAGALIKAKKKRK